MPASTKRADTKRKKHAQARAMISRMARGEAVEGGAEAQRGWDTVTYMKLNCLGGNDT